MITRWQHYTASVTRLTGDDIKTTSCSLWLLATGQKPKHLSHVHSGLGNTSYQGAQWAAILTAQTYTLMRNSNVLVGILEYFCFENLHLR